MSVQLDLNEKRLAENTALEVLESCGAKTLPVDPAGLARSRGFSVDYEDLSEDNFRGTFKGGEIVIDSTIECQNTKRFIVAHELGHAVLGLGAGEYDESDESKKEAMANLFARALLMPKHYLVKAIEIYNGKAGESAFSSCVEYLSDMFGVTERRVKERLVECNVTTR
jgi:Zn-dependent peptidase ImmA (M78 family)